MKTCCVLTSYKSASTFPYNFPPSTLRESLKCSESYLIYASESYGRVNPKSDFYMLSYGMYTYITDLHYI